jgi:hypothetical protein
MRAAISTHSWQAGYLLEVPALLVTTAIVLAMLLPLLSGIVRQLVLSLGILIYVGCFYYILLTPGWQPEPGKARLPPWRRILSFGLVAAVALGAFWYTWFG